MKHPKNQLKTAMIMAAGLGERMKPLTLTKPKPMIEVHGKPLIDHIIDKLLNYGIKTIVINLHYLADQLEAHVKARGDAIEILFSDERETLLETGGGLKHARHLVGPDPLFIINADAFWTDGEPSALDSLSSAFDPDTMDILLLMIERETAIGISHRGDYRFDPNPHLKRGNIDHKADLIFGGVQIIKPGLVEKFSEEKFSLTKAFDVAEKKGKLMGIVHNGHWFHIGTPQAIKDTEERLSALLGEG